MDVKMSLIFLRTFVILYVLNNVYFFLPYILSFVIVIMELRLSLKHLTFYMYYSQALVYNQHDFF